MPKPSRGVKNNNPGNLRKSKCEWVGKVKGDDPEFETFSSPEYGIRAIAKLVTNYYNNGFNTVAKIIDRYAPPNENNTNQYINFVADKVGISPNSKIDLEDTLFYLVKAIIRMENGYDPYDDEVIEEGIDLVYKD